MKKLVLYMYKEPGIEIKQLFKRYKRYLYNRLILWA